MLLIPLLVVAQKEENFPPPEIPVAISAHKTSEKINIDVTKVGTICTDFL